MKMSNIWFLSDTHFGSDSINIKCNRPSNWEDLLSESIKCKVKPGDTLIHLGDVVGDGFNFKKNVLRDINCKRKVLVLGNHDKHFSDIHGIWYFDKIYQRGTNPFLIENFDDLGIKIAIRLSHEPLIFDEEIQKKVKDDEFITTSIPVVLNIHGHLHNLAKIESVFPHFNVSVEEISYELISLNEILEKKKNDIINYYNKLIDLGLIN